MQNNNDVTNSRDVIMDDDDKFIEVEQCRDFTFFHESEMVLQMIKDVTTSYHLNTKEKEKFKIILSIYQEEPEVLDLHLESLLNPLTSSLLKQSEILISQSSSIDDEIIEDRIKLICQLLQCITKVRGIKSVIKFYPVEIKCFKPILKTLLYFKNKRGEDGIWECQSQLMLWLSSLVLIPFDLKSFDDNNTDSCINKIYETGKMFLKEAGASRDYAALLICQLLIRSDKATMLLLDDFMNYTYDIFSNVIETSDIFSVVGITQTIALLFKHGDRNNMIKYAELLWPIMHTFFQHNFIANNQLLRKLVIKICLRIGLTFLKPITPMWRYIQKSSNLSNEHDDTVINLHGNSSSSSINDNDEENEITEEVEEVIEILLEGISCMDTMVRWSSAKGIGQICARLPKELALEVLNSILNLFSETETDCAWHGACFTVAELARRGLLMTESIPLLAPKISNALLYDINKGSFSIGAHVRDAACYICWACSRSFDAEIMSPFMSQLAPILITTACLDREVNCRRAASAAFQECVGRLEDVPHGIDVLLLADYFTLSSISQAYTIVTPAISKYEIYRKPLIENLLYKKLRHWDINVRILCADTLALLAPLEPDYFSNEVLDLVLDWCLNDTLDMRHGAMLGLSTIIVSLTKHNITISSERHTKIANIVMAIEKARLYRGKGGGITRQAVSKIIESISTSNLTRSLKHRLRLLRTLDDNIKNPVPDIQLKALKALYPLSRQFICDDEDEINKVIKETIDKYCNGLHDENVAIRQGYAAALGQLPKFILEKKAYEVIDKLCGAIDIEEDVALRDANTRANATNSLTNVILELYSENGQITSDNNIRYLKDKVIHKYFYAMEDYSTDNRGDVGNWVRTAAMNGLCKILLNILKDDNELSHKIMCYLVRNSIERISHVREVAVMNMIKIKDSTTNIHDLNVINEILDDNEIVSKFGAMTNFDKIIPIVLKSAFYKYSFLEGLIASIGGLDKSLSDITTKGFKAHLAYLDDNNLIDEFLNVFISLWEAHRNSNRMITPCLKTLDIILRSSNSMSKLGDKNIIKEILKLTKEATKNSTELSRLTAISLVLSKIAVLPYDETKSAWNTLVLLLGKKYPIVRKSTAENIYEQLLFMDAASEVQESSQQNTFKTYIKDNNELMNLLLETAWDGALDDVLGARNKICDLIGIKYPIKIKKENIVMKKNIVEDENASYVSLVNDFERGF